MNFKKFTKDLFLLSKKGESLMEIEKVVSNNMLKKVELQHILEKIDNRELYLEKNIIVEGFLSRYAPLYETDTYYNKTYRISNIKINKNRETGEIEKTRDFIVEGMTPPVVKFEPQDGENIAFLYLKNIDNPFEFEQNEDRITLKVEDRNKYIPIYINEKDLINLSEKIVEIECSIILIDYETARNLYKFRNREYKEIYSYFYDDYNERVKCISLKMESILKIKDVQIDNLVMEYGVEYDLTSNIIREEDIEKYTIDSVNKVINTDCSLKGMLDDFNNKEIKSFLTKDDIDIKVYKNKIGFYMKLNMYNRNNRRAKKIALEKTTEKFFKNLNKNIEGKIIFITDENDKDKFI